jgi:hypothetical protein
MRQIVSPKPARVRRELMRERGTKKHCTETRARGRFAAIDRRRRPCNLSTMRFTLTLGLLVTLTAVPALAEAAPRRYYRHSEYREREYYSDHDGLFARVTLGAGGVAADDDLNEVTLSGGAGLFSLDLGGSVAPNLALHGRFSVNSMFEPNISSDGEDLGDLDDTSLTLSLLGVGLTY